MWIVGGWRGSWGWLAEEIKREESFKARGEIYKLNHSQISTWDHGQFWVWPLLVVVFDILFFLRIKAYLISI
jgi:hypothetical protein